MAIFTLYHSLHPSFTLCTFATISKTHIKLELPSQDTISAFPPSRSFSPPLYPFRALMSLKRLSARSTVPETSPLPLSTVPETSLLCALPSLKRRHGLLQPVDVLVGPRVHSGTVRTPAADGERHDPHRREPHQPRGQLLKRHQRATAVTLKRQGRRR